jgi:hypothetical protein
LPRINDPVFVDTPARHRDGEWLATALDDLGLSRAHLRGLHYRLIERTKPNGLPYTNTFADWAWLLAHPAKAARWLGYIGFDRITDERNAEPVVRLWTPPEPKGYVSTYSEIYLPDADDLTPKATLDDFVGIQPYHLVLVGEKSSLRDVLEPIADEYEADLYLPMVKSATPRSTIWLAMQSETGDRWPCSTSPTVIPAVGKCRSA